MRKFLVFLCTVFLFLGLTLPASAISIPFQISGGSLDVVWNWGGGIVDYTPFVMPNPVELDEGGSVGVTFGSVYIPLSLGRGEATFTVEFSSPTPLTDVSDTGDFAHFSYLGFNSLGIIDFGDPQEFAYDYNGLSGGVMTVGFDDLKGIESGTWVPITGTITNTSNSVPEPATMLLLGSGTSNSVPEPATMLLLGSGLIGLVGFRRKKLFKE